MKRGRATASFLAILLRRLYPLLRQHPLGELAGQLLEMNEAVGIVADAERDRAQLDDEVVDLRFGHVGGDDVPVRPVRLGIETEDLTAPTGDQALHLRGE